MLAAGESPSDEDAALVDAQIETVLGELARFGEVEQGFTADSIPEWAHNPMRDRVAFLVAPDYRVPSQRLGELAQEAGVALALLLRHAGAYDPSGRQDDVSHRALVLLGVIRPGESAPAPHLQILTDVQTGLYDWLTERGEPGWALTSIPDWAMDWWRDAVAYRAAPMFQVVDPNILQPLVDRAQVGLREITKRFSKLTPKDSKEDLGNRILTHLQITDVAEKPTDAQRKVVDDGIEHCLRQLRQEEVIGFQSGAIPDWAYNPLRDYVAWHVAPTLQRPRDPAMTADRAEGLRELRAQSARKQTSESQMARYF